MIYDAIKSFNKQFEYEPKIKNAENFKAHKRFVVAGMGGSHLAGDIVLAWKPALDAAIHMDYGLPAMSEDDSRDAFIIASSYSGNTEETISAFEEARRKNLDIIVISIGGKLLELAKEHGVPYIQMPDMGLQPRLALGFSVAAMLKAMGEEAALDDLRALAEELQPAEFEGEGQALAKRLLDKAPVIYASLRNRAIIYNWKIKFNETGKIPAFYNVFPELNHNEMTGFDVQDATKMLSEKFYFLLLRDNEDHPRIIKRMDILERLYKDRGLPVETINLGGTSRFYRIFSSLILADWTAFYTAKQYGVEAEQVPMVEEFKKLVA